MKFGAILLAVTLSFGLLLSCKSISSSDDAQTPLPALPPGSGRLIVHADQPSTRISPTVYGLMTEEINHAYDGGLYAELIQNRIFRDPPPLRGAAAPPTTPPSSPLHWSAVGDATLQTDTDNAVNDVALKYSLRADVNAAGAGVANDGFWGIPVWPKTTYRASFYARGSDGLTGPLTVAIESKDAATVYAKGTVDAITSDWHKYELTISTAAEVKETDQTQFVITSANKGKLFLSLVSLFPPTYNNRPNGLRVDLMEKLLAMHPSFLRFPGGNYVEGNDINNYFDWKKTIGPLEDRPGHQAPWTYRTTDGLGMLEFLEWCEDLKIQPVLAVFAGYTLNRQTVPRDTIDKYVQDAMDEIEYVTGDAATTKWGAERAKDGHPEPFQLNYVEIGNEDNLGGGAPTYEWRFPAFFNAIKAKYPNIQVIATAHLRSTVPDLFDDHTYSTPNAMYHMTHRYDAWPRTGPKIFFGEWATRDGQQINTPNMLDTLGDAAWLGGLERDSDVVNIASYAPLFVNVNPGARQWATNLIGYNALHSFGSPSYYMQELYAENRGDWVLPAELKMQVDPASLQPPHGAVGVGTYATVADFKDLKVTQGDKVLYQSDFTQDTAMNDFRRSGRGGNWAVQDGALHQSGVMRGDITAMVGDTAWTDYTYEVKARKVSGAEGFLIPFHAQNAMNTLWWNLGGWGDTASGLEMISDGDTVAVGPRMPDVKIDADMWYTIRIEIKGSDIKCYLNDKLIEEATEPPPRKVGPIFAYATRENGGNVILKVVNNDKDAHSVEIRLDTKSKIDSNAKVQVISGQPMDVNTIDNPTKVVPVDANITNAGGTFTHEFPAYSVSVMRLDVSK